MNCTLDEKFMWQALKLAERGGRAVMPNPMVGAVLANKESVVATGWHQFCGGPHAEVNALAGLSRTDIKADSTLYLNLEPCSHHGRTPPCVNRIIDLGIKRVVIAHSDPNPRVNGAGVAVLRSNGVEVVEGVLEQQAHKLNRRFLSLHKKGRPYVILKWAQTCDHFMARSDHSSKWISCATSRALVHRWRSQEQAILVGYRTALSDDPALNVRVVDGTNPIRCLIDRDLTLPANLQILSDRSATIIYNSKHSRTVGELQYVKLDFKSDLSTQVLRDLAQREIISLFVEGGAATLSHFLAGNNWDEARIFVNPNLKFGQGLAAPQIDLGSALRRQYGSDFLITLEH